MKKNLKKIFILIIISCYLVYCRNYNWTMQGLYGDDYNGDLITEVNKEIKKYGLKLVGKFKDSEGRICELYEKSFFFFHIYTIYAYSDQGKVIWVARGIDEINTGLHWNRHFYGYINWDNKDGFILSQIDYFEIENGNKPMLNFYP